MNNAKGTTMRTACGAAVLALLTMGPAAAQEVIAVPGEDRRIEANFEELYRIGGLDGQDWEQFGSVSSVAFDGAGRLYVLDGQVSQIFLVDTDGTLIRQIGREGDGPGEFRDITGMVVMEDGRTVVRDVSRRAYHVFDPNGDFERMVRMGGDPSVTITGLLIAQRGANAVITTPIGSQALSWSVTSTDGQVPQRDPPTSRPVELVSLAGEETVTDTLVDGWLPPGREVESRVSLGLPRPFTLSPGLHWGVLPDGSVAFADSTAYAIKIAAAGTGISRVLTRSIPPEPMTDRMISAEKDRRFRELEAIPDEDLDRVIGVINGEPIRLDPDVERQRRQELIENLEFFYEVPVIRGLFLAWDGTIWVRRRGEEPASDDGPVDLLTPDGAYLGSFPGDDADIPDAFGPGGLAAFIETDEFGVKTVVVGRLSVG
ncbi:MAG: 6-bladed beta-propeller [Gemmatimonadota bacterium]|nr:6-bladed beta-propeller [Gemmatimonadota bacterium]